MNDEFMLTDDDWAAVRDAVPSFASRWRAFTAERYDATIPYVSIHGFAEYIVNDVVRQRPEELRELGETLEAEYTRATIHDIESYEGLLTVGLLEGLIEAADECGMPLRWLRPLLYGERVRQEWNAAIAWQKPDFVWSDGRGAIPSKPLPRPIGTVEVHRGRRIDAENFQLDARLIGGRLAERCLIRYRIGKDFWHEEPIVAVRRRASDIDDEFEIDIRSEQREDYEIWDDYLFYRDHDFWQIAEPADS